MMKTLMIINRTNKSNNNYMFLGFSKIIIMVYRGGLMVYFLKITSNLVLIKIYFNNNSFNQIKHVKVVMEILGRTINVLPYKII